MNGEHRPASSAGETGWRGVIQGATAAVAAHLVAILVYYAEPYVAEPIRADVRALLDLAVTAGVVGGLSYLGARRRDDDPAARTLRRTPF